ncbi:tetratricopeptide repeat protein [Maribacter sp. PR1]|uniref:Tetratricopeptide repeat protein n=1 Tax=Maribacter cobaltidurans TaxID=1178778 RepID=A0ABU7IRG2_9FLAO|nr:MULTISPECIES: tetratricopeptide repeat protein [Maribacter]MDC6388061.1 tetratricopeptide repeat protein [Maribacter sp. PR1]MEE1975449.1 tetratricopeptide repeat protein [Maribacter cobaltidurans]
MKISIKVLTLFLLFSCQQTEKTDCNYITDYFPHTTKAEIEFYSGNYETSFQDFQKAFLSCQSLAIGNHNDIGLFAKVCAELGKEDLALDFIEKRIAVGGTIGEFQNENIFDNLLNSKRGKKIVSDYEQKRAKFISSLNLDLRSEIQNMIRLDQQLNSTKLQDSMFQVNDKRLVQIIDEYGYPNEQIIGPYNLDQINSDPTILLLHTDDSIRINYFIPRIKKFIEKGKCSPYTLGTVLDNLELFNGKPQTHGTYLQNGGGHANMISDIQKVNANRKNIGLPTIEMTKKLDSLKMKYWESR